MADSTNNTCFVICENCGFAVVADRKTGTPFSKGGWRLKESRSCCPQCRQRIDLKHLATRICPHCGQMVEDVPSKVCPNPNCGKSMDEAAQTIALPDSDWMDREDWAIWKCDFTIPCESSVRVSEGTFALLVINGECMVPCGPGTHRLDRLYSTLPGHCDAGLSTVAYCVRRDLPKFQWGTVTDAIEDALHRASYTVGTHGSISLSVCDAKAYACFLGFKPVKTCELIKVAAPSEEDGVLITLARDLIKAPLRSCICKRGLDCNRIEGLPPADIQDELRYELNRALADKGLRVGSLFIHGPLRARKTEKYQAKDRMIRAVESVYKLSTDPIRVHARNDASIHLDMVFSGSVALRVRDENVFFSLSEIESFMAYPDAESDAAIQAHFNERMTPLFNEAMKLAVQSVVNQKDADIRELHRYSDILKACMRNDFSRRLERWGIELESMDLDGFEPVGASPNFYSMIELESARTGACHARALQRLQSDRVTSEMDEWNRAEREPHSCPENKVSDRDLIPGGGLTARFDEMTLEIERLCAQYEREHSLLEQSLDLQKLQGALRAHLCRVIWAKDIVSKAEANAMIAHAEVETMRLAKQLRREEERIRRAEEWIRSRMGAAGDALTASEDVEVQSAPGSLKERLDHMRSDAAAMRSALARRREWMDDALWFMQNPCKPGIPEADPVPGIQARFREREDACAACGQRIPPDARACAGCGMPVFRL